LQVRDGYLVPPKVYSTFGTEVILLCKLNLMIKYALILANLFGFLTFGIFIDDGVIIEDNTPTTLSPGETKEVQVTINKGDVEGFAKLQIELPEGLTASALKTEGASFTFSAQKIKFIWMALPESQEFTVSYSLTAASEATGNKAISGTFSYIKTNQRIDYELPTKIIEVRGEAAVAQNQNVSEFTIPINGMACVRTITEMGGGEYLVTLDLVNASLDGFAKIKESIPTGYAVSEDDSDGAVVTIDDSGIKYIWFDAPTSDSFTVSYRLNGESEMPAVFGVFSFVENNAPREMNVLSNGFIFAERLADNSSPEEIVPIDEPAAVDLIEPEVIEETAEVIPDPTADKTTDTAMKAETVVEPEVVEPEVIEKTVASTSDKINSSTKGQGTSVPAPETGVSFKIQIVAAHKVVGQPYFKGRHGFDEQFDIENHEGWVKYTTGGHDGYKQARDDRERIKTRYNFQGPFVTAYNEGDRITVQEALMISKQKWFK
jgi:hypothetical protein